MFKWITGRQNTGYFKMPIFVSKRLRMDCYLLKFEQGTKVPWHVDPSEGRHFRFNLRLNSVKGGEIVLADPAIIWNRWFHLFRPDINKHMMTEVEEETLYILSIGKVLDQ